MTAIPAPRFRVRWRHDVGFEMQCLRCESYWPMELEHWAPRSFGLSLCRACGQSVRQRRVARSRRDETSHRWYMANRERINAKRRLRQANRTDAERADIRAQQLAWREANRERLRIYNRLWRLDHRAAA